MPTPELPPDETLGGEGWDADLDIDNEEGGEKSETEGNQLLYIYLTFFPLWFS